MNNSELLEVNIAIEIFKSGLHLYNDLAIIGHYMRQGLVAKASAHANGIVTYYFAVTDREETMRVARRFIEVVHYSGGNRRPTWRWVSRRWFDLHYDTLALLVIVPKERNVTPPQ